MSDIEKTLKDRHFRYGDFHSHAAITQKLKAVMRAEPAWNGMTEDKRESLEMIAHKIGRIINGDPNYHDSWHDIAGYAQLVARTL